MISFGLTKRQKIILAAILTTVGLLSTQMVNFDLRFRFILGLSAFSLVLSSWALWDGFIEPVDSSVGKGSRVNFIKAGVLMILPTLYTLAVASFYFLLPIRWLTRLPVALLFGLSFYLLLLSQNVFNVASIRTIPLYRAASTAAFLFTLIAAFFIYGVIFAFPLAFYLNGLLVAFISFWLILQLLWSIEMEEKLDGSILIQSGILSLILGELAAAFSFWPMVPMVWSLALASAMYVLAGLTTQRLRAKLPLKVLWEYLFIGIIILTAAFLTTSWTG